MSNIIQLFERYYNKTASADEVQELMTIIASHKDTEELEQLIWRAWQQPDKASAFFSQEESALLSQHILQQIGSSLPIVEQKDALVHISHRKYFRRRWHWAAAATLAGLLSLGTYYFVSRQAENSTKVATQVPLIAPGNYKAVLTLADGSTVTLDSAGQQLIQQGAAALHHQGRSLKYEATGLRSSTTYNTLATPRGGQFQIILSDGTKVWLNAASSIRYPTSFTSSQRKVEVKGEAYFEVAKNPGQPFIVSVDNAEIQVLGTSFNVNAYPDETSTYATLVTGLIKVKTNKEIHFLQPGKMVAVLQNGSAVVSNANIKAVMAWKNGRFWFENTDIQTVMRQLARWYDIQISYEGPVSQELFSGSIERSLPLSEVLFILERNEVKYRVEGRKLIIY